MFCVYVSQVLIFYNLVLVRFRFSFEFDPGVNRINVIGDFKPSTIVDVTGSTGAVGEVLTRTSTGIDWAAGGGGSGMTDPMTTAGDLIYRNSSNVTTRLPRGSNGQVLKATSTGIAWGTDETGGGGLWTDGGNYTYLTSTSDILSVGYTEPPFGYKLQVNGYGYFSSGLTIDGALFAKSLRITEEQSTITGTTGTSGGVFRVGTDNKPYFVSDFNDGNQVYDLSGTLFTKDGSNIYYNSGEVRVGTSSDLGSFTFQAYSTTQNALTGQSTNGNGIYGSSSSASGIGTVGNSSGINGEGIRGQAVATSGINVGGKFISTASPDGIGVSISARKSQFSLDLDSVTPPSTSTSPGIKGEVRVTENYIYVCTATNTWKRIALTTW